MWFQAAATLVLSSLPLLATAAPATSSEPHIDHDVIIVGGGPSGLSALSGLARVRRNVLLIDSGEYRNGPTRHMHDVLGFDGVTPAYYRWAGRQQISHYKTVSMRNGTVTKIEAMQNNTYFRVCYAANKGARWTTKTARKIILATGLRDRLPETPGIRENWGEGIYWCPWCDGKEHADQRLGLIGPLESIPGLVREILSLNRDIVAFVNGTDTPTAQTATDKASPRWRDYLKIHKVRVENRTIASVERTANGTNANQDHSLPTVAEYDRFLVTFASGEPVARDAFLTSFKNEQASKVGEAMGVKLLGGRLTADGSKGLVTNIPGVYAVGDANSDNSTNVPHALFSGKRTAVFVHVQLERETAEMELAAFDKSGSPAKRSLHEEARSVWDLMNGRSDEKLHAGSFDQ
ncbi:hypothetical protein G6O67_004234 [Ophiocordyceps sinensis]|uniref:FAD/NAD(P)-binding domain-containing protein n=2 Tax=Ophiocordyceps sinensis TaxID=72228 RepID=A0A8H4M0B5_9HYPO|nr:hypothetical protein G6O67_004234 [Ophiocordyceps sinensis]